jgi:DNA-binding NtrC family response regulator
MPSSVVQFRDNDRETVLLVEPDVLVRAPLTEYLRRCGYRVFEAVNADEASLVLDHAKFRVNVVLTTVEMPGSMNGFQLSHWVRLRHPEIEVILAGTVRGAVDAAADLCEAGPRLTKPYDAQVVVRRIKQALAARDRDKKR